MCDALAEINHPAPHINLILQICFKLPLKYGSTINVINARKSLLNFLTVLAMVMLEEARLACETQPISSLSAAPQIGSNPTAFVASAIHYSSNNINQGANGSSNSSG